MIALRCLPVLLLGNALALADATPSTPENALEVRGPYKSMKAMCKTLAELETRYEFHGNGSLDPVAACSKCVFECNSDTELWRRSDGLPKPIDELVFFISTATTEDSGYYNHMSGAELIEGVFNVAIRTGKEWFLVAHVDAGLGHDPITINAAKIQPMGGGGTPILVVRYTSHHSNSNKDFGEHQSIFAIGVGPTRKPGATLPVEIMHHVDDTPYGPDSKERSTKTTTNYHIEVGALVIENSTCVEKEDGHTTRKKDREPKRYSLELP
jgi:hypothetical protein